MGKRQPLKARKPDRELNSDKIRQVRAVAKQIEGKRTTESFEGEAGSDSATGIVKQKGRLLSDGTRKGERTLRRVVVCLPLDLAKQIDMYSAEKGIKKRETVIRMAEHFFDEVEA